VEQASKKIRTVDFHTPMSIPSLPVVGYPE
jgi:hypothetical protein